MFLKGFLACYLGTALLSVISTLRSTEFRGEWFALIVSGLTWPGLFFVTEDGE